MQARQHFHTYGLSGMHLQLKTAIPIGEGATGRVMKAWSDTHQCFVALKYLKAQDADWVARLRREAAAVSRVEHPNIPKVYGVETPPGEAAYIAMQYIDGEPLDKAALRLSLEERVTLLSQISDALHAAHQAGLVHRDLKPANIMIETLKDGAVKPWLVDFGLVLDAQQSQTLTQHGDVMGTPSYMAPEQARGTDLIDRRTDVYALGALLFYLLTDQHPWQNLSSSAVLTKVLQGRFPAPLSLNRQTPKALNAICLRACELEPRHRYTSASAFAADLDAYLKDSSALIAIQSVSSRLRRTWRFHKVWWATIATAILVLAGNLIYVQIQAQYALQAQQRIQTLTAEVEQNAVKLRLARMTPDQDIAPLRKRLNQRYRSMLEQVPEMPESIQSAALAAIGRGVLAGGESAWARQLLGEAIAAGQRDGASHLAYAVALVQGYQDAIKRTTRERDPSLRAAQLAKAKQEMRDPALAQLSLARQFSIEESHYGEALLALLEDRYLDAVAAAELSVAQTPWRFESLIVKGAAFAEQGRQAAVAADGEKARKFYTQAAEAFAAASTIAPSAAAALEQHCATLAGLVFIDVALARTSPAAQLSALDESCQLAARADSDSPVAWAEQSQAYQDTAMYRFIHGEDPESAFNRAEHLAQQALNRADQDVDVWYANAVLMRRRAIVAANNGADPQPYIQKGIDFIKAVVALDPEPYRYYNTWANLLLDQAEYISDQGQDGREQMLLAAEVFQQALDRNRDDLTVKMNLAVTWSLLAEAHEGAQDLDAAANAYLLALSTYHEATDVAEPDWDAVKNQAVLQTQYAGFLKDRGDNAQAADHIEQALDALRKGLGTFADDRTALLGYANAALLQTQLPATSEQIASALHSALDLLTPVLDKGEGRYFSQLQARYFRLAHQVLRRNTSTPRSSLLLPLIDRYIKTIEPEYIAQQPESWKLAFALARLTQHHYETLAGAHIQQLDTLISGVSDDKIIDGMDLSVWINMITSGDIPTDCQSTLPKWVCSGTSE